MPSAIKPTYHLFEQDYDTVWKATLKTIAEFPLTIIEKQSGILNTDWIQYVDSVPVIANRGFPVGQKKENMPREVRHRLNILVSQERSGTKVNIIRYVQTRPYRLIESGGWELNNLHSFQTGKSDTNTEHKILLQINSELENQALNGNP